MKISRITSALSCVLAVAFLSNSAFSSTEEDVNKKMTEANEKTKGACGCTIKYSLDKSWDMTNSDLLSNAENQIGTIGDYSGNYCAKGAAYKKKFCSKIKSVAIKSHKAAAKTDAKGANFTTFIDISNKNQMMNHGDAWMKKALE